MSEPKRYVLFMGAMVAVDPIAQLGHSQIYFAADDPAVVERFHKAELYDKGDAEWRAKLEKDYRDTIEALKAQCVAHGKENEGLRRSDDAMKKLERIILTRGLETHISSDMVHLERIDTIILRGILYEGRGVSLLSAIESVKEG